MSENAKKLTETEQELLDMLHDMVSQHCSVDEQGVYDSFALSTNADAMRLLTKYGVFKIEKEYGRRVIGKFVGS